MLNEKQWKEVGCQAAAIHGVPSYAASLCKLTLHELKEVAAVHFEVDKFDDSYIDFLQEQIELNARGEEWSKVLQARMYALKSYSGIELGSIRIEFERRYIWIRYLPSELKVVLFEYDPEYTT